MIVINLRGTTASGKSTSVREYCREYDLKPQEMMFEGEKWKFMTDGERYALGWYRPYANSEGLDVLEADKEEFKRFLNFFLKHEKPNIVVYEKMIWSKTYKLTAEIAEICAANGFSFIGIMLLGKYETILGRLLKRNGENFDALKNFDGNFKTAIGARKNLQKNGFIVYDACIDDISIENMKEIIPAAIEMHKEGKRCGKIEEVIARKNV